MKRKKSPLDEKALEFFRRMGRKGGKIGGAKGGRRRMETMTAAARSAQAYQAGVQGGRPRVVDWDRVIELRAAGRPLKVIAKLMHCSVGTVCRITRVGA
jgi:hypothetical protein